MRGISVFQSSIYKLLAVFGFAGVRRSWLQSLIAFIQFQPAFVVLLDAHAPEVCYHSFCYYLIWKYIVDLFIYPMIKQLAVSLFIITELTLL